MNDDFFCPEWGDSPMIFTSDTVTSENHRRITPSLANHHTTDQKIVIHGKPYVTLFLTRFYSIYNTGNWWNLSSNRRLFAMGLSIAVLWRHTSMHCDVILPNCPQNVSMDAQAFSRRRQVDHHALAPVTHSLQPVGDLLATKISGGCREVAGWLQGGRRPVADRLQTVAGTIWSQGGFGCCKWNLSATKSIVERFLVVADGLPTGRRLVGDWSPTSCSGCRQSRHSF